MTIFASSVVCSTISSEFEILPDSCYSNALNVIIALISLFLILPFILLSTFIATTCHEWRMDLGNVSAKPHYRYDLMNYVLLSFLIIITNQFESLPVIPIFMDFICILFLIVLHVYYMVYYKTMINILISSCLFSLLFASMISLLVATFMVFFNLFYYFYTEFPGSALMGCAFLSLGIGAIVTIARLYVIRMLVTDPRSLFFMHTLHPNDVVVPRGEFEVEMANRTIGWICGFHQSLTLTADHRGQSEAEIRQQMYEMQCIDRVDEMYKNAIDHVHNTSIYVYLSYATFLIHVARNRGRAVHLLEMIENHFGPMWLDFRGHYYIRRKYWLEELFPAREAEEVQNNPLNENVAQPEPPSENAEPEPSSDQ